MQEFQMMLQMVKYLTVFKLLALLNFKCVPSYLILSLLLLLLLEFSLCHAVLPFNPVQLLVQRALVNTKRQVHNDNDVKYVSVG